MRTIMLKLDQDSIATNHRPIGHPDVDETWVPVEWDKDAINNRSWNDLIRNKCAIITDGAISISTDNPDVTPYGELRLIAYIKESDPIKVRADNEAAYDNVASDYAEWILKVDEIKIRYPKP